VLFVFFVVNSFLRSLMEPEPKAPPAGRKFPCVKCGARLEFDPTDRALKCPYCGYEEKINPAQTEVLERDLEEALARQDGESKVAGRSSEVRCGSCGAIVLLEDKVATERCPYCGAHLDNQPQEAQAMIPPEGVLPFKVEKRQAVAAFARWIAGRWFAPTKLRRFAELGRLNGAYVPYWTFGSMTYTHYHGERGDDYTDVETYTDTEWYTDADGQRQSRLVTRTRNVTRTRWTPASGEVQHFFDDVAVCASRSLPDYYTNSLTPQELKQVEPFRPEFLSGFCTERYTVGPREGFAQAKQKMDAVIRQLCCRDIGGNHQRLHQVRTQHVGVTFKHILLPVWLAGYRYMERSYQIMVNGRTGQVVGDRPYSWVKILALVLAVLAIIAAIFLAVALANRPNRSRSSGSDLQGTKAMVAAQQPGRYTGKDCLAIPPGPETPADALPAGRRGLAVLADSGLREGGIPFSPTGRRADAGARWLSRESFCRRAGPDQADRHDLRRARPALGGRVALLSQLAAAWPDRLRPRADPRG
jgi:DNA-directed RNA polymerase subunit RPC12/RpoP